MSLIKLKAKSSSGNYYLVTFEISDKIKVSCNCNAGIFGKLCKHKTGLLIGDRSFLYDSGEEAILFDLVKQINKSDYVCLSKELLNVQKEIDMAKKKEKKIKGKIELLLKEGLQITSEG